MGLLKELRLRLRPPKLEDPDFGPLLFMYIPRDPSKSYWEAEWPFPPTGTQISISLPGSVEGPTEAGRQFYLAIPARFEEILRTVQPILDRVFRESLGRPLHSHLWQDVKLAGFGVEDPDVTPPSWDIAFETTGEKWLGILIPFVGNEPQEAVIDT